MFLSVEKRQSLDWMADAACRNKPTELFFPTQGDSLEPAIAICDVCPVSGECLNVALDDPTLHGVWGGTSAHERRRLRSRRERRSA